MPEQTKPKPAPKHTYKVREVTSGRFAVYDETLTQYVTGVTSEADAKRRKAELEK